MRKEKISIIIAEDDPATLEHLKQIVSKDEDFNIVGETNNGKDLITIVKEKRPRAIFVDIEMPQLNGMSAVKILLEEIDDPNIFVVFITGHIGFAIEAFEIASTDYVLKPFNEERINKSLARIKESVSLIQKDVEKIKKFVKTPEKLYVKCGYELHFINCEDIYCLEKSEKKTLIHTKTRTYETNDSLTTLEERLNPNQFLRSHKSFLINLLLVEKIIPWGDRCYQISFDGTKTKALITRAKIELFYKSLNVNVQA